ncbi:hypothetical protein PTKIN_Ptkin06aG0208000 [Pterospermum kingtungense]
MISCLKVKKCEDNNQTHFIKNGGVLLEELVAFSNGRCNPIRHFSAQELLIATNYYNSPQIVVEYFACRLYRGALKDLPVLVKKYDNDHPGLFPADLYKDIAIGSQMSVHKNVLKVIGCFLETQEPTIVYEFGGTKSLSTSISATHDQPLPWNCMLKIAVDIANAIAYLHNAFSRPVIHRDIAADSIILDQNNVPKLIDFGLCISIPEGQSHVKDAVIGRTGWPAPELFATGYLTEKVDVYQFGMLLLELLIGKAINEIMRENILNGYSYDFSDLVARTTTHEGTEAEQWLDFKTLVLGCICIDGEKRPTMIEVAKELRRIYQSFSSPC